MSSIAKMCEVYAHDIQRLHNSKRIVGYVTEDEISGIAVIIFKAILADRRRLSESSVAKANNDAYIVAVASVGDDASEGVGC